MRTVILTIKPHHLHNIRTGRKTIELRKTRPTFTPFLVLCCESGSGGQIKAQFWCDSVRAISPMIETKAIANEACVRDDELKTYAGGKTIYAWKVSDVVDWTREKGYRIKNIRDFGLNHVPQSWCYVKEQEGR